MARLTEDNVRIAQEIISRYPRPRSATIPLLHLAQEQDGYVTEEAMAHIGELVGASSAEVYVGIESPRGEIGCYIVSDGSSNPYRMHMRAPSFVNIQAMPHMMRGGMVADAVAVISSVDPVLGEVDR